MVVFEDGLPRKSEYRRFAIRGTRRGEIITEGGDVDWIREAVRRRMARYLDERIDTGEEADDTEEPDGDPAAAPQGPSPLDPETGRPRKFAYPPNLLVVDGGAPQVAAAQGALDRLGIDDVALCGLAKRLEEVWLPGEDQPVILPRTSEALYLLQRVRDEAHRFAITYHRQRRSRAMTTSALDGVPGLGETRKKALLTRFGSLKRLRAASVEDIMAVPGVGRRTAESVAAALHREDAQPGPAVDPITGEVLDG
jgi:excinuclease ABC subunit C